MKSTLHNVTHVLRKPCVRFNIENEAATSRTGEWKMTYQERIASAANLDDLCDGLNAIEAELAGDDDPKLTDVIDTASLPVFGGTEPADTRGIYSWDESRILTPGNANNWIIKSRDN